MIRMTRMETGTAAATMTPDGGHPWKTGDGVRHEGVWISITGFLGGPEETACTESLGGHECVGKERGPL